MRLGIKMIRATTSALLIVTASTLAAQSVKLSGSLIEGGNVT